MDVSVVLCTFNRAHLLPGALEALAAQQVEPDATWELVVVDNNSRDATRAVVEEFAARSPMPVRYVFEGTQGLSVARNTGIAHSKGEIIAFTEDDARPAPDWVGAMRRIFAEEGVDVLGGPILPLAEHPVPRWLRRRPELLNCLGIMPHAERVPILDGLEKAQIWGGNMAFRRAVVEQVGAFDALRGRIGRQLFGTEDVDLVARAMRAGLTIVYDPRLVMRHLLLPERMRRRYILRWHFEGGQGEARRLPWAHRRRFLGVPLYAYRDSLHRLSDCVGAVALRRPEAVHRILDVARAFGRLSGFRRRAREERTAETRR